jgi:hypothetical protein
VVGRGSGETEKRGSGRNHVSPVYPRQLSRSGRAVGRAIHGSATIRPCIRYIMACHFAQRSPLEYSGASPYRTP